MLRWYVTLRRTCVGFIHHRCAFWSNDVHQYFRTSTRRNPLETVVFPLTTTPPVQTIGNRERACVALPLARLPSLTHPAPPPPPTGYCNCCSYLGRVLDFAVFRPKPMPRRLHDCPEPGARGRTKALVHVHSRAAAGVGGALQAVQERPELPRARGRPSAPRPVVSPQAPHAAHASKTE